MSIDPPKRTRRARKLRKNSTDSESLLWEILRAKQLCNLKFRRQHPIGSYFVDYACVSVRLAIEIDGTSHDSKGLQDKYREAEIRKLGWDLIRFSDQQVQADIDAVGRGIANHLGLDYEFEKRDSSGSGMKKSSEKD